MKMIEIWKDIEGYEGYYQISSIGGIRSIDRIIVNRTQGLKRFKGKVMNPTINTSGYFSTMLSKNGLTSRRMIHQLVAIAFLNHKPCGTKLVVNHKNYIKTDNRVENLEIITTRENSTKSHIKSASQYVGVCLSKKSGKWFSRIAINGKRKFIGVFEKEVDAHLAYQNELNKLKPYGCKE